MLSEAEAQDNCLATYIPKVASGATDVYVMRSAEHPDASLVTVEVRRGTVRQAFQSHNRQLTEDQRAWLSEWCESQGIAMPTGRIAPRAA
jgi:hypothetical protein